MPQGQRRITNRCSRNTGIIVECEALLEVIGHLAFELDSRCHIETNSSTDTFKIGVTCFAKSEVVAVNAKLSVVMLLCKHRRGRHCQCYDGTSQCHCLHRTV